MVGEVQANPVSTKGLISELIVFIGAGKKCEGKQVPKTKQSLEKPT